MYVQQTKLDEGMTAQTRVKPAHTQQQQKKTSNRTDHKH